MTTTRPISTSLFSPEFTISKSELDKTISKIQVELWDMIFDLLHRQCCLKSVAQFAFTCKTAFNFVYFTCRIREELLFCRSIFLMKKNKIVSYQLMQPPSLRQRELLWFNTPYFLIQDTHQALYFTDNLKTRLKATHCSGFQVESKGKRVYYSSVPTGHLYIYNVCTMSLYPQETHLATLACCDGASFWVLDSFLHKDKVIVLTNRGWFLYGYVRQELTFQGFFSPFSKEDILAEKQILQSGKLAFSDTLTVEVRGVKRRKKENPIELQFNLSDLKPGFEQKASGTKEVTKPSLTSLSPMVSNGIWQTSVFEQSVLVTDCNNLTHAILFPNGLRKPVFRLVSHFLFVFEKPVGPFKINRVGLSCSLFYLPTQTCLFRRASEHLFHLIPDKEELYDVACKRDSETGAITLISISHKIYRKGKHVHIDMQDNALIFHEWGFKDSLPENAGSAERCG